MPTFLAHLISLPKKVQVQRKQYTIADISKAIEFDYNYYSFVYCIRGEAYYIKKNYNQAIADFEAALRIDPNDATAIQMLKDAKKARGW